MPGLSDKPLLTFAIAALNQEKFIREAVAGAFAQTYSRLEIVLSDDCSQDRTFQIMQEMAAEYRGPHRVILNQNPVRRGLGGHINRIVEISHGELIVGAAGDDVSASTRTQRMYEIWEQSGRTITSVHSNFTQIDEAGGVIAQRYDTIPCAEAGRTLEQGASPCGYVKTLDPVIFGCAHAFSRRLFTMFGDLPENIVHEDNALGFRSVLRGKIVFLNEPLVNYRLHGNNIYLSRNESGADLEALRRDEERLRRFFRNRRIMYDGFLADLEHALKRGWIAQPEFERTMNEARKVQERFSLLARFLDSGLFAKCRILFRLRRLNLSSSDMRTVLKRLLPEPVFVRLRLALACARASRLRVIGRSSPSSA